MVNHSDTMRAIAAGVALLVSGAVAGYPRTVPATRPRYWSPFQASTKPKYPRGTHDPGTESNPWDALYNHSVLVDQSCYNFHKDDNPHWSLAVQKKKKVQRALAIGAFLKRSGVRKICFILDPPYRDRDAPKDDIRKTLPESQKSKRGVPSHYTLDGVRRNRHRFRGSNYIAIATAIKNALEAEGFDVIFMEDDGEAELLAAHLTRLRNDFDTILTKDAKDAICFGTAKCVVDVRSVDGVEGVNHCYVYETREAARAVGIRQSSLPLLQILYGDDNEPGHRDAYGRNSPFETFKQRILYLETFINGSYPDVLAVLIGRVEGRIAFDAQNDRWWSSFIGAEGQLHLPAGRAARAYAHTILKAYQRFRDDAPARGATPDIIQKVKNAGMPAISADELERKVRAMGSV